MPKYRISDDEKCNFQSKKTFLDEWNDLFFLEEISDKLDAYDSMINLVPIIQKNYNKLKCKAN